MNETGLRVLQDFISGINPCQACSAGSGTELVI